MLQILDQHFCMVINISVATEANRAYPHQPEHNGSPMPKAPNILSVQEAGRVIGIGRTMAYAQARAWLATDGAEGFPCRRVGRLIQVYRPTLEQRLGFEIIWPLPERIDECLPQSPRPVEPTADRAQTRSR